MRKLFVVFLVLIMPVLASCDYIFPSTWNYRITVEIETPEGIKTGSAVRQVSNYANFADWVNPDVSSRSTNVKGEAVVIELGERGVVFALVSRELYEAFPVEAPATKKGAAYYDSLSIGTSAPLPEKSWPTMVTFTDINDLKSVMLVRGGRFNVKTQQVDPVDELEEIFGKGVHLKSITIEITDNPVTWGGVDKYLGKLHAVGPYEFKKGE